MTVTSFASNSFLIKEIASYLDVDSLLRGFNQINKTAYTALDNEHFKRVFESLHPKLAGSPFVFQVLRTFHPGTCWKVACWMLARPHRQMTNLHFLSQAPLQLPLLKAQMDRGLKEICGSGFGDPASLIHQAWLAMKGLPGAAKACKSTHTYPALEKEREKLDKYTSQINHDIQEQQGTHYIGSYSQKKWLLEHHDFLAVELEFARTVEDVVSGDNDCLDECHTRIENMLTMHDNTLSKNSVEIEKLRSLINSLPNSGRIWHTLYIICAKEAQEDRWSENHFHEFLQRLDQIIIEENDWFSLRQDYEQLLKYGSSVEDPHDRPVLYREIFLNYRNALLLYGDSPISSLYNHFRKMEWYKMAPFKWDLVHQLISPLVGISQEERSRLDEHFQTRPAFDDKVGELLQMELLLETKKLLLETEKVLKPT